MYGFGAKLRNADGTFSAANHCFPVYGEVEVEGVEGIMTAYQQCLNSVMLSGPTIFGPLLRASTAASHAYNCSQANQQYGILLILTDGVINDMQSTIDALIEASAAPLSVIIVGVGNADFTGMVALDSDDKLLKSGNATAKRDIVQFVPFSEAAKKGDQWLAAEILREIPTQLLQYMEAHNIKPNKI